MFHDPNYINDMHTSIHAEMCLQRRPKGWDSRCLSFLYGVLSCLRFFAMDI